MVVLGIIWLGGCVVAPNTQRPESPARTAGDRPSVSFDEVIVALPVEGAHQVYQNLHVGLDAIMTMRNASAPDPGAEEWIVRFLEPRVSAAVLKVVTEGNTLSPHKLGMLRESITARVDEVVKESVAQWAQAPKYGVEVVVVSLYLTDSSVGRGQRKEPSSQDK